MDNMKRGKEVGRKVARSRYDGGGQNSNKPAI